MIRKLHVPNDRADFQNWAASITQTVSFNWTLTSLLESFEKDFCWGIWDKGSLQSVICFLKASDPLEILWLATRPESEGQGFMKRLLMESIAKEASNNTAPLGTSRDRQILLEVHEMNSKAIRLYASLGFIEFGRRKNYYKDGSAALLMALKVE